MIELKPCPFCGAPAKAWAYNHGHRIDCSAWASSNGREHYVGVGAKTFEEAAELWNQRTYQPQEIEHEFLRICESEMEHE